MFGSDSMAYDFPYRVVSTYQYDTISYDFVPMFQAYVGTLIPPNLHHVYHQCNHISAS